MVFIGLFPKYGDSKCIRTLNIIVWVLKRSFFGYETIIPILSLCGKDPPTFEELGLGSGLDLGSRVRKVKC